MVLAILERFLNGAGVEAVTTERALCAAGELVEGVFWKKPRRVFCPPDEDDFFSAGVVAGVEAVLRGISMDDHVPGSRTTAQGETCKPEKTRGVEAWKIEGGVRGIRMRVSHE